MSVMHFSKSFELAIFSLWDKLEANKKLEKDEFLDLVEAMAQEVSESAKQKVQEQSVTKDEIHKLDSKIDTQVALLQARIEQSKADIIKWCITSQVAVGGMIVALVKLL